MAKKNGAGSLVAGAAFVVAVIAALPGEILAVIIAVSTLWIGIHMTSKMRKGPAGGKSQRVRRMVPAVSSDGFATFSLSGSPGAREHRIPPPSGGGGAGVWIPPGGRTAVAGFSIPGGMLYVGSVLQATYGGTEPALINPRLKVSAKPVDVSQRLCGYWPSYSGISPEARRACLQWFAGGRKDPLADIGYVFLFFYGLERRALVDARMEAGAGADLPAIKAEVCRLLRLYEGSNSFRQYATHFLDYLNAESFPAKMYQKAPPAIAGRCYELPLSLKVGLGQLAMDQQQVPADWALAWALADPNILRKTAVSRCGAEFEKLFRQKYAQDYGDGFLLRQNKTKLRFVYHPASGGLRGKQFERVFGELPDVSATKAPVRALQALVDVCTVALDPYSRFIGRNPDKAQALEGLLQLPVSLWPVQVKSELEELKKRVGNGMVVMSFGELSGRLKSAGPLSRNKALGLVRALQELHFGMEPDVMAGTRTPKPEDRIALFATPPEDGEACVGPAYHAAAVTLDLACMVALADGVASAHEILALTRHIDSWGHLSVAHRKRLKARLRLGIDQPVTLAGLKKKLEPLAADARRAIARFLAHLTQADGVVSPSEVKFLERTYKALGLDIKLVYTDLHANEAPVTVSEAAQDKSQGLALNPERIAQLQKETAEVSALLANVFSEENGQDSIVADDMAPEDEGALGATGILGLDAGHSAFVRLLVTRSSWLRNELVDAAADMELMLDGALEHINEAVLDALDMTLTEGEDPVEINHEVLEALPV